MKVRSQVECHFCPKMLRADSETALRDVYQRHPRNCAAFASAHADTEREIGQPVPLGHAAAVMASGVLPPDAPRSLAKSQLRWLAFLAIVGALLAAAMVWGAP